MDQGKLVHYRNQNVPIDVDFIAKRNVSLGTESAKEKKKKKRVENFSCRRTLRSAVDYGLTLSDRKRRKLSPRDDEKDDFQNHR